MAKHWVFSTFDHFIVFYLEKNIDLKSAYDQILLMEKEAFHCISANNGGLHQFCRVQFGVSNGVEVFQRQMNSSVEENALSGTFPYYKLSAKRTCEGFCKQLNILTLHTMRKSVSSPLESS